MNSPDRFRVDSVIFGVDADRSALIGHVEQTTFLIRCNPESARPGEITFRRHVPFLVWSKNRNVALSVIVHHVDFACLWIDIYPAHHFGARVGARYDALRFGKPSLGWRVFMVVVLQNLKQIFVGYNKHVVIGVDGHAAETRIGILDETQRSALQDNRPTVSGLVLSLRHNRVTEPDHHAGKNKVIKNCSHSEAPSSVGAVSY